MTTYFLFTDTEVWHEEITASTWRTALRLARAKYGIGGKLRVTTYYGDARDYRLDGTRYTFTLRRVA
jgi:hypothetical protein